MECQHFGSEFETFPASEDPVKAHRARTDLPRSISSGPSAPGGASGHMCAFFQNRTDEYRVLVPFVREGLLQGDRGFHIVDPARLEDHRRRLADADIPVAQAVASGQLEILDWSQAHLRDGCFDRDRMLALAAEAITETRRRGYGRTRFVTHMEWALAGGTPFEGVIEYEAIANRFVPTDGDPVICVYDLARWSGQEVVSVIQTHPRVIIGGILQDNPFFVPPDAFLQQLRGRRPEE